MNKLSGVLLLFLLIFSCACRTKTFPRSKQFDAVKDFDVVKELILDTKVDIGNIGGVQTNIDSLKINGDILSIFVNYSGGCMKHDFSLYTNGMYSKSLPPKVTLFLKHINNDDACRELVMNELKFDIKQLKSTGSLSIRVGNKYIMYGSNKQQ